MCVGLEVKFQIYNLIHFYYIEFVELVEK